MYILSELCPILLVFRYLIRWIGRQAVEGGRSDNTKMRMLTNPLTLFNFFLSLQLQTLKLLTGHTTNLYCLISSRRGPYGTLNRCNGRRRLARGQRGSPGEL